MAWLGKTLASSVGSSFVESDNGPDSTLLCKELSWLLEDSLENSPNSSRACPFPRCEHWRDLVLSVQEGVLILRSETELIVDLVSDVVSNNEKLGQGVVDRCGYRQESWFEPLKDVEVQIVGIVRNPPCIPSDNISGLQADDGGMSRLQGPSSLKRKRPERHEKRSQTSDNVVNKSLKALQVKKLIKEVVNIQNKGRKHFMATEFEPSKEISGGAWYLEGSLDTEFIESLKQLCKRQIERRGVATLEEVTDSINSYPAFNVDVTKQQIEEILRTLILDNVIMEVKSNGMGEFASIPFGEVCYKYISKVGLGGEPKAGALASIPCGVCPRISQCTPDGIISPKTCVYYQNGWIFNFQVYFS
ncbi:DNA-directed RNA polymerase III subunit RPC6-like isoform X2 [Populus alba x Populus x berolinensis]|nr:DNA-directed RNA polymerase III subunit RPC6-like isoform X2 [Populus alba x Populus x berolinensis]